MNAELPADPMREDFTDDEMDAMVVVWTQGFVTGTAGAFVNAGGWEFPEAHQLAVDLANGIIANPQALTTLKDQLVAGLRGNPLPPEMMVVHPLHLHDDKGGDSDDAT